MIGFSVRLAPFESFVILQTTFLVSNPQKCLRQVWCLLFPSESPTSLGGWTLSNHQFESLRKLRPAYLSYGRVIFSGGETY